MDSTAGSKVHEIPQAHFHKFQNLVHVWLAERTPGNPCGAQLSYSSMRTGGVGSWLLHSTESAILDSNTSTAKLTLVNTK